MAEKIKKAKDQVKTYEVPVGTDKINDADYVAPQLSDKVKPRKLDAEEKNQLKGIEAKAGVKPLSSDELYGKQPAEPYDVRQEDRAGAKSTDLSTLPSTTPISNGIAPKNDYEQYRPKIDRALGEAGHRRIYAEHTAGPGAAPEAVEAKGVEWDAMPATDKRTWQLGVGKEATAKGVAEARAAHTTTNKTKENQRTDIRNKARELSFSNPDGYKKFTETGELPREGNIEDVPNPRDPAQRAALGEPRTQPESNWRKGWVGGATSRPELGLSLGPSSKHHADLAAHIEDLQNRRLKGQGASLPLGVVGRNDVTGVRTGRITSPHFNMEQVGGGFPTANGGNILRENQFDAKGMAARDASESLAKSARAHSLGMKPEALQHFAAAVGHTKRLATIVNESNRTRGAAVPDFPEADMDKANDIHDDYKDSVNR
jgi:hypothetical protein